MIKVVVAGTFDLLHEGHKELLLFAKKLCPRIKVFVTTHDFVAPKKTPHDEQQVRWVAVQKFIGNNCEVEYISTQEDFRDSILLDAPCLLLHGSDHNVKTLSEIYGVEHSWWKKHNILLVYKDRYPGVSSSQLREELDEKETK